MVLRTAEERLVYGMTRPEKITLGDMRSSGVRGVLIYCADYKCSQAWKKVESAP